MFQELTQILGIKKTRTTPFHPQSNGQVERQHRTLLDYLAKFISENQKDWDRWVSLGLLAYRSFKHKATGFTPSELFLGRGIRLPLDLLRSCPSDFEDISTNRDYFHNLKRKMNRFHDLARQQMQIKSLKAKALYDQKDRQLNYKQGQKVWLFNPHKKLGRTPKRQSN